MWKLFRTENTAECSSVTFRRMLPAVQVGAFAVKSKQIGIQIRGADRSGFFQIADVERMQIVFRCFQIFFKFHAAVLRSGTELFHQHPDTCIKALPFLFPALFLFLLKCLLDFQLQIPFICAEIVRFGNFVMHLNIPAFRQEGQIADQVQIFVKSDRKSELIPHFTFFAFCLLNLIKFADNVRNQAETEQIKIDQNSAVFLRAATFFGEYFPHEVIITFIFCIGEQEQISFLQINIPLCQMFAQAPRLQNIFLLYHKCIASFLFWYRTDILYHNQKEMSMYFDQI